MILDDFVAILGAFMRRRPFRPFAIEMMSGNQILILHPESISREGELFHFRSPDSHNHVFTAESVCQLFDAERERH
jgi:hypothetical protein